VAQAKAVTAEQQVVEETAGEEEMQVTAVI